MKERTIAFVSGFCMLMIEIGMSRLIVPHLGDTVYTWATVVSLIFAGSSIGYFIGGKEADRSCTEEDGSGVLLKASATTLLVVPFYAVAIPFVHIMPPFFSHLAAGLAVVLPSFFYGMITPYLVKSASSSGDRPGTIFAFSTIGSLAGALICSFVLVPNLAIAYVFIIAALLMLSMSWWMYKPAYVEILPFGFLAFIAISAPIMPFLDTDIVYQQQSAYQLVTVSNYTYGNSTTKMMMLDALVEVWEYANGTIAYDYIDRGKLGFGLLNGTPSRALVIGAGGGSQIELLKNRYPGIYIDGIEIDNRVVEAGERYFELEPGNMTNITVGDGRRTLGRLGGGYDIVLIDVFKGPSPPPHMATREFFEEVKGKMSNDSVAVINIASNPNGDNSEFFDLEYNTLKSVFRNVAAIPESTNSTGFIRQTIVLIATDRDMEGFRKEYGAILVEPQGNDTRILTDDWSPVDTFNPV